MDCPRSTSVNIDPLYFINKMFPPIHGYFLSGQGLEKFANLHGFPFANQKNTHWRMACEIYYALEPLGILRLEYALLNGEWGYIWILGKEGDKVGVSIAPALKHRAEKIFTHPARLFTYNHDTELYIGLCEGEEPDRLKRNGTLKVSKLAKQAGLEI